MNILHLISYMRVGVLAFWFCTVLVLHCSTTMGRSRYPEALASMRLYILLNKRIRPIVFSVPMAPGVLDVRVAKGYDIALEATYIGKWTVFLRMYARNCVLSC